MNRETWLKALADKLQPLFVAVGQPLDLGRIRIGVGFPGGGARREAIGQCWSDTASGDGTSEVFISPVLGNAMDVGHVLVHELIHAAVGVAAGHGRAFGRLARAVGLIGPLTATQAGPYLQQTLDRLTAELGPYPHAALTLTDRKTQTTRMIKCECPECGYIIRTTLKWLQVGIPTCVCGTKFDI